MSYYQDINGHITDKIEVELALSNYVPREELDHAIQVMVHLIQLIKRFIALKAKVEKLDINKLINVATSLDNLKTKVDNLDFGKLKTIFVDLKNCLEQEK